MDRRPLDRVLWQAMHGFVFIHLCQDVQLIYPVDMGVAADGMGLTGVVDSRTYRLEEKRTQRDALRNLNVYNNSL